MVARLHGYIVSLMVPYFFGANRGEWERTEAISPELVPDVLPRAAREEIFLA